MNIQPLKNPKVGQIIIFPWLKEMMIGRIREVLNNKEGLYCSYDGLENSEFQGASGGRPITELFEINLKS